MTDNPVEEIKVAREILNVLGLRHQGIEIISCPTCSRTSVDLIALVKEAETQLAGLMPGKKITVAIMGCEVNGPGEAGDADIGIAFSKSWGYIFKKGQKTEKVAPGKSIERLVEMVKQAITE